MSYWYFTPRERQALIFLSVSVFFVFGIGLAMPYFYTAPEGDISPQKSAVSAFEAQLQRADSTHKAQYASYKREYSPRPTNWQPSKSANSDNGSRAEPILSPFDPNTATEEELSRLGLPPSAVRAIVNYRGKGGQFRQRSDLGKIYSIPADLLPQLLPFVQLPDSLSKPKWALRDSFAALPKPAARPFVPTSIDINTAGAEEWQKLPFIGEGRAMQIIKYRQKLGGFARVEQIAEIYGMPDSVFQRIRPQLQCVLHGSSLRRIALNSATVEELAAHPYLSWQQARAIVRYRTQLGQFAKTDFVLTIPELDDANATARRLLPYLSLD